LCKFISQIAINEKLFGVRPEDVKIERLCQFIGEDAFRKKMSNGMFETNYLFNVNILSLSLVSQMVEQVAAYTKKK
jgi:hypothetical protein